MSPGTDTELEARARRAAARAIEGTDLRELPALTRRLEGVALLGMARALRDAGLFRDGAAHGEAEIAEATGTAGRHRWILRRWLAVLCEEGLLDGGGPDGRYRGLRRVGNREMRAAARGLEEARTGLGYPPELTLFFQRAIGNLPALLRDEVPLQALLFADGETGTADGAYRDNAVNRYVNAATAEVACWAAGRRPGGAALRVLEIGAGVGGTTSDVLAALGDGPVDYLFTDVSRYFLDIGRERFGGRAGTGFALLDLNGDPLGGDVVEPGSRDVVIAANVLHNAHDIGRCLRGVRDLLAPGGLLLCIDTCRELYQILTSMQFLMSARPGEPGPGAYDLRAGTDRIFLSRAEWRDQMRAAGLAPVLAAPEEGHPLDAFSVTLLAARREEG
ncbi:class I SAM-dependent methyltransferase [Actinorugispora endophytica]|uniref:Ubiquinone/menaquinone biosynthesis C-methylase UbiE n=1 Tax=Actinorugispora endophytica TaxID=1605990 RepID=A0A4R6UWA9_9ACTN|nr:methyltransferase [Actinorugispora endophytica]TDQ50269.1 ubiquinone/menaquinone biosynthesis C-methylase UbiE [Actinorugispora endophytica]